jgi:hypothetical protein
MQLLSQERRNRVQATLNRIRAEEKAKEADKDRKQQEIRNLALQEFRALLESVVSLELIKELDIQTEVKEDDLKYWVIQTPGDYCGTRTKLWVFAQILLPAGCRIELTIAPSWEISKPQLTYHKDSWSQSSFTCIDPKLAVEEAILEAVYQFELDYAEYQEVLEQKKITEELRRQETERLRQEEEQFMSEIRAEHQLIEGLIETALQPYRTGWVDGVTLKVYCWRYCCGSFSKSEGIEFDYNEVYSLSPHLVHDEELRKSFVHSVEGNRIALDMNAHKPVIREIVINSLEDAQKKLGRAAFYYYTDRSLLILGVQRDNTNGERGSWFWRWGGEAYMAFFHDSPQELQMKPWLREMLGLPVLPEAITIYQPLAH